MKRREFIGLLGGAAASWPFAGRAQQPDRVPVIGILWHAGSESEEAIFLGAFRRGLSDLGYVEGDNIALVNTYADEKYERFTQNAAELVARKVDVLVAVTRPAALAAQHATKVIPIVAVVIPDPVGSGLAESLSRPGGNITGISNMGIDLSAKRVELINEAVSGLRRIVLLVNPSDPGLAQKFVAESTAAATRLNIDVGVAEVRTADELEPAIEAVELSKRTAIIVNNDAMLLHESGRLADLARARGLPTMVFMGPIVRAGALMSYGPNIPAIFRHSATLVQKILKGAQPADLPFEQPTDYELILNLKTAKALGTHLPATLLARADGVIE